MSFCVIVNHSIMLLLMNNLLLSKSPIFYQKKQKPFFKLGRSLNLIILTCFDIEKIDKEFTLRKKLLGHVRFKFGYSRKCCSEIKVSYQKDIHAMEVTHCCHLVLPSGCNNFRGPHSLTCLINVWEDAGCIEEGSKYPPLLTYHENYTYNYMNLG